MSCVHFILSSKFWIFNVIRKVQILEVGFTVVDLPAMLLCVVSVEDSPVVASKRTLSTVVAILLQFSGRRVVVTLSTRANMLSLSNVAVKHPVAVLALPPTLGAFPLMRPALEGRVVYVLAVRAGSLRFTVVLMLRSLARTTQNSST